MGNITQLSILDLTLLLAILFATAAAAVSDEKLSFYLIIVCEILTIVAYFIMKYLGTKEACIRFIVTVLYIVMIMIVTRATIMIQDWFKL